MCSETRKCNWTWFLFRTLTFEDLLRSSLRLRPSLHTSSPAPGEKCTDRFWKVLAQTISFHRRVHIGIHKHFRPRRLCNKSCQTPTSELISNDNEVTDKRLCEAAKKESRFAFPHCLHNEKLQASTGVVPASQRYPVTVVHGTLYMFRSVSSACTQTERGYAVACLSDRCGGCSTTSLCLRHPKQ